jgi:hypothetical protein
VLIFQLYILYLEAINNLNFKIMKKVILTILILAFISVQFNVNSQIKIGAKAGFNFSKTAEDIEGMETKTGIQLGAILNFGIVPMVSVQPELLYSQKGLKVTAGGYTTETTMNYLEIPLSLKVSPPVIPIYVLGGPYVGYWLSGTTESDPSLSTDGDIDFDANEDLNRLDYGLNVGLGFKKGFGPIKLFLEGRYGMGLAKTNDLVDDSKNINIGVSAGILLGF